MYTRVHTYYSHVNREELVFIYYCRAQDYLLFLARALFKIVVLSFKNKLQTTVQNISCSITTKKHHFLQYLTKQCILFAAMSNNRA